MSSKFTYQCCNCANVYPSDKFLYLCPECGKNNKLNQPPLGVLKINYNFQKFGNKPPSNLQPNSILFDALKLEHFNDILPVESMKFYPKLRIGQTPIYLFDQIGEQKLNHRLFFKDDSQNPTYSFKDRASALVSAYAKENGIDTIIAASTGNAGSSLAGICAAQGQKAIVMVPESAPVAKLTQIIMYGAVLIPIKGTYDDAFDFSIKASQTFGWYNRNTAYNPLTIEGKKTVVFEIYEQMDYSVPDRIFVPAGDGVIISGIYKGFEDFYNLGIIDKIPVIVAVQSEGSNNLIHNLKSKKFEILKSNTIADSISVDIPRNFYMARDYILKHNGETVIVTDDEIINASSTLSKNTGLFAEPAASAAFAGYLNYLNKHKISENSDNLVLLTGSGLKDLKSINQILRMPDSIYPEIDQLNKFLNN